MQGGVRPAGETVAEDLLQPRPVLLAATRDHGGERLQVLGRDEQAGRREPVVLVLVQELPDGGRAVLAAGAARRDVPRSSDSASARARSKSSLAPKWSRTVCVVTPASRATRDSVNSANGAPSRADMAALRMRCRVAAAVRSRTGER